MLVYKTANCAKTKKKKCSKKTTKSYRYIYTLIKRGL